MTAPVPFSFPLKYTYTISTLMLKLLCCARFVYPKNVTQTLSFLNRKLNSNPKIIGYPNINNNKSINRIIVYGYTCRYEVQYERTK